MNKKFIFVFIIAIISLLISNIEARRGFRDFDIPDCYEEDCPKGKEWDSNIC